MAAIEQAVVAAMEQALAALQATAEPLEWAAAKVVDPLGCKVDWLK